MKELSTRLKIGAALIATIGGTALAAGGCELIASVDRSLIPGSGGGSVVTGGGGVGGMPMEPKCTTENAQTKCGKDTQCQKFTCESAMCKTTNVAKGAACTDGGVVCDGMGKCVPVHCTDMVLNVDETDLDCGGKDCGGCANEKKCIVNNDCTNGFCQAASSGTGGSGGGAAGGAGGGMPMAGGVCKACASSANCNTDKYCDGSSGDPLTFKCIADKMKGAACADVTGATGNSQCPGDTCVDGVCCDTKCDGACDACSMALGAMADGTCKAAGFVAADSKGKQKPGSCDDAKGGCGGKCSCDTVGACKLKLGEAQADKTKCASGQSADGVCCDAACAGACDACTTALGATTTGTCVAGGVKATDSKGKPKVGFCDDSKGGCGGKCTCDTAGACKLQLGEVQPDKTKCASGQSADAVCCDTACAGLCDACTTALGATTTGTCKTGGAAGKARPGVCDDNNGGCGGKCICDATPACKRKQGETCAAPNQCATGNCPGADGKCCDTTCITACSGCSTANGADFDGTCKAMAVKGKDDPTACDDFSFGPPAQSVKASCDAGGSCKGKLGAVCTPGMGANHCLSTNCPAPEAVCCNMACNGACQKCSAAGACGLVGMANGEVNPGKCANNNIGGCGAGINCTCSAGNLCKRATGQADGGAAANCVKGTSTGGICD